jgi:hypothetical protein
MAHYAFIDENNTVVEVIVGRNETEVVNGISDWESYYAEFRPGLICKRTSYNGTIRKNYAGIGYTYDSIRDAFIAPKPDDCEELNEETCTWIPPQPFASWTFSTSDGVWKAPTPYPTDGKSYRWDEPTLSWVEVEIAP